MALTTKQENFVAKYIETENASEAYRYAYNVAETVKDTTIWNNSYKLLKNNTEVAARVKEVKEKANKQIFNKLVITREFVTRGILNNIEGAEAKFDHTTALKGYDMLSKMYDLNKDRQEDRQVISDKENLALVDNLRKRLVDVTPGDNLTVN